MSILKTELFARIPNGNPEQVKKLLADEMKDFNKKIIVLDDDPTGVQTVNGIHVYTDWSPESIADGFAEDNSIFFILTNSRAFSAAHTQEVHQIIAERILAEAKKTGKDFMIISRSDSTLRGHYPLETDTLRKTLEGEHNGLIDGEVLMPFFKEGGRFTIGNIHYVQEGDNLVPAGDTEFAKDKTFGYTASEMGAYIEEKTKGLYKASDTTYISLDDLRNLRVDAIEKQLMEVKDFNKVIVNAVDYEDVQVFAIAMIRALKAGKKFLFRTAAAWPKVIGNVPDKALLQKEELIVKGNTNGGLIIIGSHVKKTTDQLNELKTCEQVKFIEFNHLLVLEPEKLEIDNITSIMEDRHDTLISGDDVSEDENEYEEDSEEGTKLENTELENNTYRINIGDVVTIISKDRKDSQVIYMRYHKGKLSILGELILNKTKNDTVDFKGKTYDIATIEKSKCAATTVGI